MLIVSGAILTLIVALGGLWFWLSRETEADEIDRLQLDRAARRETEADK